MVRSRAHTLRRWNNRREFGTSGDKHRDQRTSRNREAALVSWYVRQSRGGYDDKHPTQEAVSFSAPPRPRRHPSGPEDPTGRQLPRTNKQTITRETFGIHSRAATARLFSKSPPTRRGERVARFHDESASGYFQFDAEEHAAMGAPLDFCQLADRISGSFHGVGVFGSDEGVI